MWYDQTTATFHYEDRNVVDVVAKLRHMANRIEEESFGALSLNALGDIFGNEFWQLVAPAQVEVIVRRG